MTIRPVPARQHLRFPPSRSWDSLLDDELFQGMHPWLKSVENHDTFRAGTLAAQNDAGRLMGALPLYTSLCAPGESRFRSFSSVSWCRVRKFLPRDYRWAPRRLLHRIPTRPGFAEQRSAKYLNR